MVKTVSRIGDSPGLVFDAGLAELTGLRAGDPVNVSVDAHGAIHVVPVRPIVETAPTPGPSRSLVD
jgi:antitoxin component of MazEF toxin-antitoxin module